MAVRLAPLLDPTRVHLHVPPVRHAAAIGEVPRLLEGHPDITDFTRFHSELLARERVDSTYIGNETALPHARTDHARAIVLAVGRASTGILFENSGQIVRLIFVVATPKSQPGEYLALVGLLCRVLKDGAVRRALLVAPTAEEFIRVLVEAEQRLLSKT
jgi:mannitol/fructose-specific phosphotransferase system IIA component (Ntr-type)